MPWGMVSVCAKCHIAKPILISHRNVFEGTYTSLKELFLKTLMAYYRTCSVLSRSEKLSPNVIIWTHFGRPGSLYIRVPSRNMMSLMNSSRGFGCGDPQAHRAFRAGVSCVQTGCRFKTKWLSGGQDLLPCRCKVCVVSLFVELTEPQKRLGEWLLCLDLLSLLASAGSTCSSPAS